MTVIVAIVMASLASAVTTAVVILLVILTLGHVQGDRTACQLANPGAVCALVWTAL